jgi:hypothetical protein
MRAMARKISKSADENEDYGPQRYTQVRPEVDDWLLELARRRGNSLSSIIRDFLHGAYEVAQEEERKARKLRRAG